jgi:lysyl-tRNA synthetase class I
MTAPYITLTIDQVRQIRKALDEAAERIVNEFCAHAGECGAESDHCSAQDQYKASKILSDELECLRYL